MRIESRPSVGVVTVSQHKARAVENALPSHSVLWITPSGPDEITLTASIPITLDRSVHVANAKAAHWISDWPLRLFNDVTRITKNTVYERPKDEAELIDQIMNQSGTRIILRSAFTAKKDDHTQSIVVDSIFKTRSFTFKQVKEMTKNGGTQFAMNVSGGLPIEWADLFDRRKPIDRQFSANGTTVGLPAIFWNKIDKKTQRSLTTGAFPEPLQHLVNSMQ